MVTSQASSSGQPLPRLQPVRETAPPGYGSRPTGAGSRRPGGVEHARFQIGVADEFDVAVCPAGIETRTVARLHQAAGGYGRGLNMACVVNIPAHAVDKENAVGPVLDRRRSQPGLAVADPQVDTVTDHPDRHVLPEPAVPGRAVRVARTEEYLGILDIRTQRPGRMREEPPGLAAVGDRRAEIHRHGR